MVHREDPYRIQLAMDPAVVGRNSSLYPAATVESFNAREAPNPGPMSSGSTTPSQVVAARNETDSRTGEEGRRQRRSRRGGIRRERGSATATSSATSAVLDPTVGATVCTAVAENAGQQCRQIGVLTPEMTGCEQLGLSGRTSPSGSSAGAAPVRSGSEEFMLDAPAPLELERLRTFDPFEDSEDDAMFAATSIRPEDVKNYMPDRAAQPCAQATVVLPVSAPVSRASANSIATPFGSGAACSWEQNALATNVQVASSGGGWVPSHTQGIQAQPGDRFPRRPDGVPSGIPNDPNLQRLANSQQLVVGPTVAQPQTLAFSNVSGILRVDWTVDARKLSGSDRVAVSPPFELSCGEPLTFKMMLSPKALTGSGRGATSFRKCGGRGIVQLKCEAQTNRDMGGFVTFCVVVGKTPEDAVTGPPPVPVRHNFAHCAVCDLPKDWDFGKFVDESSQTLAVCLHVLAQ